MNVALVILHADAARGGAERYTVDLAAALAQRGHRVSLIATSFGEVGPEIHRVSLESSARTRMGRYRQFLDGLEAHLLSAPYDIVHAMLPVRRCDVYHPHAGIAAEAIGPPGPRRAAGLAFNPRRRAFATTERALLSGPHRPVVLCLSEAIKNTVRRHYPLDDSHLATLFNAVDLERFDPNRRPDAGRALRQSLGIADDQIVALMIAQDLQRKGLAEALAAMARLRERRLCLVVVGKEDPSRFGPMAPGAGQLLAAGTTADVYAFYRAADFFLLPTHHDPCSLVVLEALAMGVPVISTIFNGACEIMTSGEQGIVVGDPTDAATLSEAIGRLLDPAARERMAAACLRLRERLAYPRHVDRLLEIYRGIADARGVG